MKKKISFVIAAILLMVYAVSSVDVVMTAINKKRSNLSPAFWPEKSRYGDLYTFTHLHRFQSEVGIDRKNISYTSACKGKDINIYAICDSYFKDNFVKGSENFCRANSVTLVHFGDRDDHPIDIDLDTTKINIVVIEKTERHLRNNLFNGQNHLESQVNVKNMPVPVITSQVSAAQSKTAVATPLVNDDNTPHVNILSRLLRVMFNPNINSNLEFNLFDYPVFTKIKELKASINEKWFGRTDEMAVASTDNSHLLWPPTISSTSPESSFSPYTTAQTDSIVNALNTLNTVYKKKGFDYVYFLPIPSPATIIESKYRRYNNLIPVILNRKDLQMATVDLYTPFSRSKQDLYSIGDTHWTSVGYYAFLNTFNALLEKLPAKK